MNAFVKTSLLSIFATVALGAIMQPSKATQEKLEIGAFKSRAIFGSAVSPKNTKSPLVIMIPGSGPNGPEEMSEPTVTVDHQHHSIFNAMAEPLRKAGAHTLQLGKPGVEFFDPAKPETQFYDIELLKRITWQDYLKNVAAAIEYAKSRPDVDTNRIYLLGHSEGTQVAVDFAQGNPDVAGLILLGFMGEDVKTTIEWQLYRRQIDKFVIPDVDKNSDGIITMDETALWPGANFGLNETKKSISIDELEQLMRQTPQLQALVTRMQNAPSLAGVFDRGPIYNSVLTLNIPVYVMTGALDLQTRTEESLKLQALAKEAKKANIEVKVIPGLGHGFSPPRPPRSHPLLDLTLGPVEPSFQEVLFDLGKRIFQ